jgi:hypothetical protein
MSGASAGAVVSCSGANCELRWRFKQFKSDYSLPFYHRVERLLGRTAHSDAGTIANQRPNAQADRNTDVYAGHKRKRRNGAREQYASIQRAGHLQLYEHTQEREVPRCFERHYHPMGYNRANQCFSRRYRLPGQW